MATYTQVIYTATSNEIVISVKLKRLTSFTYNASNYWTFTVRHRNEDQDYGELVGSTLSLATRSLTAGEPVTLYDAAGGLLISDGDELVVTVASTGSPAALGETHFLIQTQKIAR